MSTQITEIDKLIRTVIASSLRIESSLNIRAEILRQLAEIEFLQLQQQPAVIQALLACTKRDAQQQLRENIREVELEISKLRDCRHQQ